MSLLLVDGVSMTYVKQLGHHSMQVTVDINGHLVPQSVRHTDRLDTLKEMSPGRQPIYWANGACSEGDEGELTMRITDIRTTRLAVPLSRVFRGGTYEITARCTIITEVLTDTGINGCTYAGDERTRQREIVHIINARLKPLLIGQDPRCRAPLGCHVPRDDSPW